MKIKPEAVLGRLGFIREVRKNTRELGIPTAITAQLKSAGIGVSVRYDSRESERWSTEKSTLFLVFHDGKYTTSVYGIAALPNRSDIAIMGDRIAFDFYLGDAARKYLLGIEGVSNQKTASVMSRAVRYLRRGFLEEPNLSNKQASERNALAYSSGVKKLQDGGAVVYSPDGGHTPGSPWTKRTGELVNMIPDGAGTRIVMTHVMDNSDWALLGILPGMKNIVPSCLQKGVVHFSPLIEVAELKRRLNITEHGKPENARMTNYLNDAYKNWLAGLSGRI